MRLPTIDTRKVWLDELADTSERALLKLTAKELKSEQITAAEAKFGKLCGGYLYLLKIVEENNLLSPDDSDNPFQPETIH